MTHDRDEQLRVQAERLRHMEAVAGNTAHDLKNLLGIVLSCAEFAIEAASQQPELRADLMEIIDATARATALATSLGALATEVADLKNDPGPEPAPLSPGETILVVEDENALRRLTTPVTSYPLSSNSSAR